MDNKPAQNIQDTFLNTVRKTKPPSRFIWSAVLSFTGKIRSFDKYSVLLGKQQPGAIDFQARHFDGSEQPECAPF